VRQESDVVRELGRGLGDAGECREKSVVRLARVGLAGDAVHQRKPHLLRDQTVQPFHARVVAVEQVEKGSLRAGGPADSAEAERRETELDLLEVQEEVLDPECRALADGGRLGGLEVGEAERRQVPVLAREDRQRTHAPHKARTHQLQRFPVLDQVRVVADVCAVAPRCRIPRASGACSPR